MYMFHMLEKIDMHSCFGLDFVRDDEIMHFRFSILHCIIWYLVHPQAVELTPSSLEPGRRRSDR